MLGKGLHAGGQPAPLWGHGSSAQQEGWTHMGKGGEGPGSGTASTSQYLI